MEGNTEVQVTSKDFVQPVLEEVSVEEITGPGKVLIVSNDYKVIRPSIYAHDFRLSDMDSFKLYVQQHVNEKTVLSSGATKNLRRSKTLTHPTQPEQLNTALKNPVRPRTG